MASSPPFPFARRAFAAPPLAPAAARGLGAVCRLLVARPPLDRALVDRERVDAPRLAAVRPPVARPPGVRAPPRAAAPRAPPRRLVALRAPPRVPPALERPREVPPRELPREAPPREAPPRELVPRALEPRPRLAVLRERLDPAARRPRELPPLRPERFAGFGTLISRSSISPPTRLPPAAFPPRSGRRCARLGSCSACGTGVISGSGSRGRRHTRRRTALRPPYGVQVGCQD